MACSRIMGSKRFAIIDAATKAPTIAKPIKTPIPANQYFLRVVTRGYPIYGWRVETDCFLNLHAQRLLVGSQEKAVCHSRDVIADHAVNGPMLERLDIIFRQFVRMRGVEFEQLVNHGG